MDVMLVAETAENIIDTNIVSQLMSICTQILGIATTFPLNIFLTASFVGIGVGVVRSLKHVVA